MKYLFLLVSLFLSTAVAANDIPPPPTLATKAFLLRDYNSGNILAQQNANERIEPASLTKLMAAYLTFKALKNGHLQLTQTLPVSVKAWKIEGSKMFIEPDMPVTVDELLHGMIIQSGNDASIALARHRQFRNLRRDDEQGGRAPRHEEHPLHERDRHAGRQPLHHCVRPVSWAMALIHDFPTSTSAMRSRGTPTTRSPSRTAPAAVARPLRRRHEDQPHRKRGLLPDFFNQARRYAPDLGDSGYPSETARAVESQKLLITASSS